MSTEILTQKQLKEFVEYDELTGIFIWIKRSSNRVKIGDKAGCKANTKNNYYILIRIDSILYKAHRLAWLYIHGEYPEYDIDHINGDGLDNRIENLRSVDHSTNMKNQKMRITNTSGVTGVYWRNDCKKWEVKIGVNGKNISFGCFKDKENAVCVRKKAEYEYNFHVNHGQVREL